MPTVLAREMENGIGSAMWVWMAHGKTFGTHGFGGRNSKLETAMVGGYGRRMLLFGVLVVLVLVLVLVSSRRRESRSRSLSLRPVPHRTEDLGHPSFHPSEGRLCENEVPDDRRSYLYPALISPPYPSIP
jgi:hypothetical protein